MKKVLWQVMVVSAIGSVLFVGCASTTVIHTNPEGARVFVNGEEVGETPFTYSDKRIAGTTVELQFLKKGYEPISARMTRDEEFNLGACLGGGFLLVPFLWILDYKAEHYFDLPPRAKPLSEFELPVEKSPKTPLKKK